jgi:capsule polysaccharide export protein KpsE/RkpR
VAGLKKIKGAVALRTAMRGTKPFRRADETTLKPARATNRFRLTQLIASLQFAPNANRKAMSNAVERIVDTYVQLNDSHALGDLRRYRQELAVRLKAHAGLEFSFLIGQVDAEIAVIEAGLDRLRHAAHSA